MPSASNTSVHGRPTVSRRNASDTVHKYTNDLAFSIELYFDNMTTMTLFRRPTFYAYLYTVLTPKLSAALAAAMFSFSARFAPLPRRSSDAETLTEQSVGRHARA